MKLKYSGKIFEKRSNFMKFRPVGAELFHADGQTNMTKLIVAFRNFVNAPKNEEKVVIFCSFMIYLRNFLVMYAHL
jgi:hypothetical protein